jgi:hypothetical protein
LLARFFARAVARLFDVCFLHLKNQSTKKQMAMCRRCVGAKTVTAKRAEGAAVFTSLFA